MGRDMLGPMGAGVIWTLGMILSAVLSVLALGLSAGEWRSAGRAARGSARQARRASGVIARGSSAAVGGATWLLRAVNGTRRTPEPPPHVVGQDPTPPRRAGENPPIIPPAPQPAPKPAPSKPLARIAAVKTKALPRPEPIRPEGAWRLPPIDLLTPAPPKSTLGALTPEQMQANARLLETVLADYGVQGQILAIRPGPVVTLYELEPAPGTRAARVIGLADDVARSLSVLAVRVAVVPGRSVLGIEVPNAKRETVYLSELIASETWDRQQSRLGIALGKDISGAPVLADLARMPHLLVAGTTGSGKSVGINAMILSLLYKLSPAECRLIMIDPKMLELSVYGGIPHLMAPVVTEPAKAVSALKWTVREMERRYRAMSQLSVRNLAGYNERVTEAKSKGEVVTRRVQTGFDSETNKPIFEEQPLALETLPLIVVVIDEMADLMMVAGKEIEMTVMRLAQMARAAGIHVIMATQRPSVDVITGTIKANFPTRISFRVVSKFDSRTILQEQGAEQLLGQGDMLFQQDSRTTRVHGPFVSDKEVEDVVAFLREQGEPDYLEEITEAQEESEPSALSGIAGGSDGEKNLFDQAVDVVTREGKASTSFIQRHLQIGYNRAAKLIEQMGEGGDRHPRQPCRQARGADTAARRRRVAKIIMTLDTYSPAGCTGHGAVSIPISTRHDARPPPARTSRSNGSSHPAHCSMHAQDFAFRALAIAGDVLHDCRHVVNQAASAPCGHPDLMPSCWSWSGPSSCVWQSGCTHTQVCRRAQLLSPIPGLPLRCVLSMRAHAGFRQ